MSFDIFFHTLRYDGTMVEVRDPFTQKVKEARQSKPLTKSEVKAVQAVLKKAGAPKPDEFGGCLIQFDDGGYAEFMGSDLANGCSVSVGGMTPGILQFLWDLLKAGNWAMTAAMEDAMTITAPTTIATHLPPNTPEVVVCESPEEVGTLLSKGLVEFKKYRDQVVGRGSKKKGR